MHPLFERLFKKLIRRWETYQDAPRDPDLVTSLATARADLDDTRREITDVRRRLYPEQDSTGPNRPGVAVNLNAYHRARMSGFQDSA